MNISVIGRGAALAALMLLSTVPATPVQAQVAGGVLQIPCCRCVDGRTLPPVQISTGTVGWVVRKPGTTAFVPVVASNSAAYVALAPATWVGAPAPGNMNSNGVYVFELRFNVPNCVIGGAVSISGRFAADNSAVLTLDNATPIQTTPGFNAAGIRNFSRTGIGPGNHVLRVTVTNLSGPMAMALAGAVTVRCPRDLVIGSAAEQGAALGGVVAACADGCS